MTKRKSRRTVYAALLLLASPTEMRQRGDGISLAFEFDSIAEMRSWLDAAGLNTPDTLTGEHSGTTVTGRSYRELTAYPTWHGWKIYATATEYTDPSPLDEPTRDGLTALVVA
ncbi:hypothetical protein O7626_29470 [Micromonospora sp. WMMD1102]|uniref:hypothetical protein n=1 Tax=Micromonospora sp. WMMD1102 TaxID=3016105 RepID=UPI002415248B|nr:hypothetical protein [Micromonospora sp. WMMD1102]MDG4790004.1 hypothetical protein [Micromonospora sp. WMMD1102]